MFKKIIAIILMVTFSGLALANPNSTQTKDSQPDLSQSNPEFRIQFDHSQWGLKSVTDKVYSSVLHYEGKNPKSLIDVKESKRIYDEIINPPSLYTYYFNFHELVPETIDIFAKHRKQGLSPNATLDTKIISQSDSEAVVLFSEMNERGEGGGHAYLVHFFTAKDGVHAIVLMYDRGAVPKNELNKLENMIENAKLTPNENYVVKQNEASGESLEDIANKSVKQSKEMGSFLNIIKLGLTKPLKTNEILKDKPIKKTTPTKPSGPIENQTMQVKFNQTQWNLEMDSQNLLNLNFDIKGKIQLYDHKYYQSFWRVKQYGDLNAKDIHDTIAYQDKESSRSNKYLWSWPDSIPGESPEIYVRYRQVNIPLKKSISAFRKGLQRDVLPQCQTLKTNILYQSNKEAIVSYWMVDKNGKIGKIYYAKIFKAKDGEHMIAINYTYGTAVNDALNDRLQKFNKIVKDATLVPVHT